MAGDGNLMGAIEMLLTLEKQTRTGGDMHSTSKILVAVVQMCYEAKEWTTLNEHLILLSKKRSQLKAAVTKMVQVSYCTRGRDCSQYTQQKENEKKHILC